MFGDQIKSLFVIWTLTVDHKKLLADTLAVTSSVSAETLVFVGPSSHYSLNIELLLTHSPDTMGFTREVFFLTAQLL